MNEKKIPSPGKQHRARISTLLRYPAANPDMATLCQEIHYLRARLAQTKRWLRVANKATAAMSIVMERTVGKLFDANQRVSDSIKSTADLYRRNREWAQSYSELQCKCDLLEDEVQTLKARYEHTQ